MIGDYKEVLPLDNQKYDNAKLEECKAFKIPGKSLFHYTSREVFWKIVEDETFLARHILFSNDSEEYELGKEKIDKILKQIGSTADIEEPEKNERYMICFCEEKDLLSQWRGYAQNGIAMEFDFSLGRYGLTNADGTKTQFSSYHCFTLVNNEAAMKKKVYDKDDSAEYNVEEYEKRYVSRTDKKSEKLVTLCIAAPYKVFYVEKNESEDNDFDKMLQSLQSMDNTVPNLIKLIPYIKNEKFGEEMEYRLVFDLWGLIGDKREWIRGEKNIYLDVDGVKKPNIRVEFGNALERLKEKTIRLYYSNNMYKDALEKFVASEKMDIELVMVSDPALKENEILLGNGQKQEMVMRVLSAFIQSQKDIFVNTKIWCDGHLPMRRIMVGPSKDAELMKKSIIQYKHNKYWMKYIDVVISDIPFRN